MGIDRGTQERETISEKLENLQPPVSSPDSFSEWALHIDLTDNTNEEENNTPESSNSNKTPPMSPRSDKLHKLDKSTFESAVDSQSISSADDYVSKSKQLNEKQKLRNKRIRTKIKNEGV